MKKKEKRFCNWKENKKNQHFLENINNKLRPRMGLKNGDKKNMKHTKKFRSRKK